MARTKQTPKRAVRQPRLPRARFTAPMDDATPSTSSTSGSAATADTGGKQPPGRATKAARKTGCRWAPVNMKRVPPALRIMRENANARMTGANATPSRLLQAFRQTKGFQMEAWNESTSGDQVLPDIYGLAVPMPAFPASHQGSGTRF